MTPEQRERERVRAAVSYARDPELKRTRVRAHYVTNIDRERVRTAAYRQEHRAEAVAYALAWSAANPDQRREYGRRRSVVLRGVAWRHTRPEWLDKSALLGNVCIYCGEVKPLTRDHKIPLVRGGNDAIENIVPACRRCNCRKGRRTATEYLATIDPDARDRPPVPAEPDVPGANPDSEGLAEKRVASR